VLVIQGVYVAFKEDLIESLIDTLTEPVQTEWTIELTQGVYDQLSFSSVVVNQLKKAAGVIVLDTPRPASRERTIEPD
jgi:hypothetical protein